MNTTNNTTIRIIEQPGTIGPLKASQLSRLIEAYIQKHPAGITEQRKEQTP